MEETIRFCVIAGEDPDELSFGYDEDHPDCMRMKYRLVEAVQELIASGVDAFAGTVEQGVSMWGAEACVAIKRLGGRIRYIAAPRSEEQADRWHPERRDRYFDVLSESDGCVLGVEGPHGEEYLFAHAGLLLILGDAKLPRLAALIARAGALGIPVKII